ncbi:sensor histidine kinase [Nocardioides bruguierae]|uniref:Sensor-like histidine kinase SenX3 n=1 Tax=Nocardioides bruguierae TaxID=2945102 RepID=A0A9X2DD63_9ACTN|nr:ATP-binding protein [Nocardioides bruguierae]MCM0622304.1 ATP-binding protein [Nocardioides bruguierae]
MTRSDQPTRHLVSFLGMAVFHAAMVLAGIYSVPANGTLAATSPAAGAALLWVLTCRNRTCARVAVVASGLLTVAVVTLAGLGLAAALLIAVAGIVQVAVVAVVVLRPDLELPYRRTNLPRVVVAIVAGSLAGTAVAAAGLPLSGIDLSPLELLAWWGRQAVGLGTVGFVGVFLWSEHRAGRSVAREVLALHRSPVTGRLQLIGAAFVSYGALAINEDAFVFLALPPAIWIASRYSPVISALHVLGVSGLAIGLTATGHSALAEETNTPAATVLSLQVFLLTLLLTVLTTAVLSAQRATLLRELRERDQERAERLELFGRTTAAMSDGLAVYDEDGTLVLANEVATLTLATTDLGTCPAEAGEVPWPTDGRRCLPTRMPLAEALELGRVSADVTAHTRGEHRQDVVFAVTAASLRASESWSGRRRVLVVFRDVTDERAHREALTDFAARAAHDLRSPVAAARSWIGFTQHQVLAGDELDRDDIAESLQGTGQALDRMLGLVSGLLDQATATEGRLRRTETDLAEPDGPLHRARALQAPDAVLTLGDLPHVEADPELLVQLFGNLLGNAVKYAQPGHVARVHVEGRHDGERAQLRVTDNGLGVPEDQRDVVFDRLSRAHRDLGVAGSGLGLSICRTIVERHGGTIRCEAADPTAGLTGTGGPGTTFVLDLPASADRAVSPAPAPPREPASDTTRVRGTLGSGPSTT